MKAIATVLLVVALMLPSSVQADGTRRMMGVVTTSCGKWIELRRFKNEEIDRMESSLRGMICL
jgi:hypothetical protein